uniref:Uncharacterized protein n=1 Tax=Amphimedon queenslandica TaxID=400682 RepID=A0A1X7VM19_AMPQE
MGDTVSTESKKEDTSVMLQVDRDIMSRRGQFEADGIMAAKFNGKRVSVPRPSKIIWIGVLLEKNDWIHTGIGFHNDITLKFNNGKTKQYKYCVMHGVADDDEKYRIYLSFANDLTDIYEDMATAFGTRINYSFSPVVAGDTWTTNRFAGDVIRKMESFIGLTFKMAAPLHYGQTNCVHFSVVMFLYFAAEDESKWKEIVGKFHSNIRNKDYTSLLSNLQKELHRI